MQWRWPPLLRRRGRYLITSQRTAVVFELLLDDSLTRANVLSPAGTPPSSTTRPATPPTTASTRTCQSSTTEIRKWRTGVHQLFSYTIYESIVFSLLRLSLPYVPLCLQDPSSLRSDLREGRCDKDPKPAAAPGPGEEGRAKSPDKPLK